MLLSLGRIGCRIFSFVTSCFEDRNGFPSKPKILSSSTWKHGDLDSGMVGSPDCQMRRNYPIYGIGFASELFENECREDSYSRNYSYLEAN
jgi:hypothetical protein